MKIITFAAIKGGVGKTTLAFNYAEWLAANNDNVLLIDLDHQYNLSQIYDHYDSLTLAKYDYIILDTHPDFATATKMLLSLVMQF